MSSNRKKNRLPAAGPAAEPGRLAGRLRALTPQTLRSLRRGIEKESLRARRDGTLARTPHPAALGSALTHPHITTDFSESQVELITGVHDSPGDCLGELAETHQFVHRNLGGEILWAASMPCALPPEDEIPIGQYGSSNVGRAKTVYRIGLSHRYGRHMQTISGIHYNFSLPETAWTELQRADDDRGSERAYRDAAYFSLIRNFRRQSWLLLYLFGASPAVCESFLAGRAHPLQPLAPGTLYLPHATSLRMGPLGYKSDAQATLAVSFNGLDSYAASLSRALSEPWAAYERIGVHDGNGGYRQLSTTLLQIENEFYGTIRPKRTIRPGERPLHALSERGVEYVEVRCLDLDPLHAIGIDRTALRFLDVFLLHCLLRESPPDTPDEIEAISRNQYQVAQRGREENLQLARGTAQVGLAQWGSELLEECAPIAAALDDALGSTAPDGAHPHRDALAAAQSALEDPSLTPAARSLREMALNHGNSFGRFVLARSLAHHEEMLARPLDADALARQRLQAEVSIEEQGRIEQADSMPFEVYRRRYLAGELPLPGPGEERDADAR